MQKNDSKSQKIFTPRTFREAEQNQMIGPNGKLLFVACNSAIQLAKSVKSEYDKLLRECGSKCEVRAIGLDKEITQVFPDTETCCRYDFSVSGSDAYVFQNVHENLSGNTVNENLFQMFQVIWGLKEHGANRISVITPYGPYTRQDKPTFMMREPTTGKMVADFLKTCGVNTHIVYHPHTYALYGCYGTSIRYTPLSGLHTFVEVFKHMKGKENTVVLSVDAGGAKFTIHYATEMGLPYAIANKFRSSGEKSEILGVIGEVHGKKTAIIIDDETITGSSIINAVKVLYNTYGIDDIYVGISHLKVKDEYYDGLIEAHEKYGLKEMHVTDSVPQKAKILDLEFIKTHSLSSKIASTINHLHYNHSITEIFDSGQ